MIKKKKVVVTKGKEMAEANIVRLFAKVYGCSLAEARKRLKKSKIIS